MLFLLLLAILILSILSMVDTCEVLAFIEVTFWREQSHKQGSRVTGDKNKI